MKYYRVKQDTFLWKVGAVLKLTSDRDSYIALEDIWDSVPVIGNEYVSARIIEHPDNSKFFERVYLDTITGKLFRTKDQLIDIYHKNFD
jgi:hypothetical protein